MFFIKHPTESASKDILKCMKKIFADSEAVKLLDYDTILEYAPNSDITEKHNCSICGDLFGHNLDQYNCRRQQCEGLHYKGDKTAQSKKGRKLRASFVFSNTEAQLKRLLEYQGKCSRVKDQQF